MVFLRFDLLRAFVCSFPVFLRPSVRELDRGQNLPPQRGAFGRIPQRGAGYKTNTFSMPHQMPFYRRTNGQYQNTSQRCQQVVTGARPVSPAGLRWVCCVFCRYCPSEPDVHCSETGRLGCQLVLPDKTNLIRRQLTPGARRAHLTQDYVEADSEACMLRTK